MTTDASQVEPPRTGSRAVLVGLIIAFVGLAVLADQTGFSAIWLTGIGMIWRAIERADGEVCHDLEGEP
jgi:2-methylisocitrate lyase-like PEP mutase family enzyme